MVKTGQFLEHKFDGGTTKFLDLNRLGQQPLVENGIILHQQILYSQLNQNGSTYNVSSVKYIAYCFHNVDGFSKIGQYVGNSSGDEHLCLLWFSTSMV